MESIVSRRVPRLIDRDCKLVEPLSNPFLRILLVVKDFRDSSYTAMQQQQEEESGGTFKLENKLESSVYLRFRESETNGDMAIHRRLNGEELFGGGGGPRWCTLRLGANTGQFGQWHSPFYYPRTDTTSWCMSYCNIPTTRARKYKYVIPTFFRGILHAATNARARCLQTHTCSSRHTTSETRRFPLGIRVRTS